MKNCLDKCWRYRRALESWVSGWLVLSLTHSFNIHAFCLHCSKKQHIKITSSLHIPKSSSHGPVQQHSAFNTRHHSLLEALLFHLYFRTPSHPGIPLALLATPSSLFCWLCFLLLTPECWKVLGLVLYLHSDVIWPYNFNYVLYSGQFISSYLASFLISTFLYLPA